MIRRTTDRLPRKRYGGDRRLKFDSGQRELETDAEIEDWAVDTFDELEAVDDGDQDDVDEETEIKEIEPPDDEETIGDRLALEGDDE